jgi:hypothetical protein
VKAHSELRLASRIQTPLYRSCRKRIVTVIATSIGVQFKIV